MFELIVDVANAVNAVFWNLSKNSNTHAKMVVDNEINDAITNFQHGKTLQLFIFLFYFCISQKNIFLFKFELV